MSPQLPAEFETETRLMIFGLSHDVTEQEVQSLLGRCNQAAVQLLVQPGTAFDAVALVHLPPGRMLAWRLCEQLNQRSLRGRRLQSWVPAMAWS